MGRESGETTPRQALMQARIVWAAMMLSILGMGAAALFLIGGGESSPTQSEAESGGTILPVIALVALLGGTFVGYLLRQQTFKAGWTGNAVKPQAFLTGTILLMAPVEGASVIAVVLAFVEGSVFPSMLLAALGLAVLAINFPTGSAMDETLPDLTAQ